ncbi:thioredoxin [Buchananella hordeovulneris]|nr:thioredoxin [Buchananella hordeovulneris]
MRRGVRGRPRGGCLGLNRGGWTQGPSCSCHYGPMSSNPTVEPQSPGGDKSRATVISLLAVIAVLAAVIVILLFAFLKNSGNPTAAETALNVPSAPATVPPATGAPDATAAPDGQAPTPTMPEKAESLDNPQALELVRAQPRRQEGDPMALGKVDAPVVLIEYADFACPYCTKWAQETKPHLLPLVEDGTLRIEWHNFPVLGPESTLAAQGSVAAANQNKFWEFYDHVFGNGDPTGHTHFSVESLVATAEAIGVPDIEKFKTDLESDETKSRVEADVAHARDKLAAASTPLFIINDTGFPGAMPTEFFLNTIQDQLARVKGQ